MIQAETDPPRPGMTWRRLGRDLKEFPATMSFCLLWIVVFAAMTYAYLAEGSPLPLSRWLLSGFSGGQRFGDLTLRGLANGEIWRLITCTFVHYSLLHIGLNLMAMYQLGTLLESWYGTSQLVMIYGLTGGGGNLIAALIRYGLGERPDVHSGGGSVVILGLIGLCAVVGWRSRDRMEILLGRIMLMVLIVTALLGLALPKYIDNWGHAGGTLVGFALGLAHRRLLRNVSKPSAWGAGVLTGLVILGCGAAQFRADRREATIRQEATLVRRSVVLPQVAGILTRLDQAVPQRQNLQNAIKELDAIEQVPDLPARTELPGIRAGVEAARARPLSEQELHDFHERLARTLRSVRMKYQVDQRELRELRRLPQPRRPGRSSRSVIHGQ
jgi:membrane associated rhomboid family serine protease